MANFSDKGGVTVSVDAVWPQLAYVERGIIDVLVGQDFSAMGSQGVDALYKLIKNEEVDLGGDEKTLIRVISWLTKIILRKSKLLLQSGN